MAVLTDQRDQIVRELTRHCGDGRLTLDELEARIEEAYAASTAEELRHVLRELPSDLATTPAEPVREPVQRERPTLPPLPDLPKVKDLEPEWHKPVGLLCMIGGFVLLFNGMFWLAILCWFVLPGLLMQKKACR